MVDVIEQLTQYATRLGDRTDPVELDEVEAQIQARGNAGVSMLGLQPESGGSKLRLVILAAAAAALVVVASVGTFLLILDDDSTDIATEPGPSDVDPDSPTFGHESGWTELESGPLEPRKGAATVWTGTELIVVGGTNHTDGAAYDPRTRTWRTIAEPPMPVGDSMNPTAVWTGSEVLMLRRSTGWSEGEAGFVAYDPSSDSWRILADPPRFNGPTRPLVWAGSEAILVGASAAYDPESDSWRSIDHGPAVAGAAVVWADDVLVLAMPGTPTVIHDPEAASTELWDPAPDHGIDFMGGNVAGVLTHGDVVIVDEAGRASRLDLDAGTWHEEADDLRTSGSPCIPAGWSLADGRSVWDLCGTMWVRTADGEWSDMGPPKGSCCLSGTVGTGAALLAWVSNDDVANDPDAPHKALWVWVPPEASETDTTESTEDFRTGPPPDPNDPTYGFEPGWHDLYPGPLDARTGHSVAWTDNELIVFGGENEIKSASYNPLSGHWRVIADPPFEAGWNTRAQFVSTGSEVIVVLPYPDGDERNARQTFAYQLATNTWRELSDAPPYAREPSEMVWTGTEVILADAAAAFDPWTDTWRPLDLPSMRHDPAVVWTGEVLVLAVPGAETVVYDPATDSTTYLNPPPDHGIGIEGGFVGGAEIYGRVVIVDEVGRTSSLNLATGTWQDETIVEFGDHPCVPKGHALDDGRSVWELCGRTWIRSFHGEWALAADATARCCLRGGASTGTVLLYWVSDGDEETALRIWVPPDAPAPRVQLEDGTHEGHIEQIELGTDRHLVTIELLEFFFNEEAVEEAMADGAIDQPDGLPNPYYVRGVGLPSVLLEAHHEADVWVLNDTRQGVRLAPWDELVAAADEPRGWLASPITGFPVEIDVEDGVIVEIRQFYTP